MWARETLEGCNHSLVAQSVGSQKIRTQIKNTDSKLFSRGFRWEQVSHNTEAYTLTANINEHRQGFDL